MKSLTYALFFISTSKFFPSLAGAYFQTDFGVIFTITLPLFMRLKRFLMKVLHVKTNRMIRNRSGHRFPQKIRPNFRQAVLIELVLIKKKRVWQNIIYPE